MNKERIIEGWHKLADMHLGEFLEIGNAEVRRVPGGWVIIEKVEKTSRYQRADAIVPATYWEHLPPVFVPYSDEYWRRVKTVHPNKASADAARTPLPPTPEEDEDNAPF